MSDSLFGRKWQVQVFDLTGNTVILDAASLPYGQAESIELQFDVEQVGKLCFWYGDIILFNLAQETHESLVEGMRVVFSAGYDDPSRYGQIFDGHIFQVLYDRDNNVDTRTTLHCVISMLELSQNFLSGTLAASLTQQREIVNFQARNSTHPIPVKSLPAKLADQTQPRGITYFGNTKKYLDQFNETNGTGAFINQDGLSLGTWDQQPDDALAQVITPETGLIGIPQQIQWGVKFKTLLDPRIKVQFPCYQVKLDSTTIAQIKRTLNTNPSMQDWGGYYNVAGVRHFGNSRGNDWYTEVTAVTPAYGLAGMLAENYA